MFLNWEIEICDIFVVPTLKLNNDAAFKYVTLFDYKTKDDIINIILKSRDQLMLRIEIL